MTDKTWDVENPKDLPYRFSYAPISGEVYVIWFGFHGPAVSMVFENRESYHRFLVEGNKTDTLIADRVIWQAEEILKGKQGG